MVEYGRNIGYMVMLYSASNNLVMTRVVYLGGGLSPAMLSRARDVFLNN